MSNSSTFVLNLASTTIPTNDEEAMSHDQWYTAVKDEISALHRNGTWTLTDLPLDKRAVGCKWEYTLKFKADGTIDRYRSRLVAKGYSQTPGVDYGETFSPVAKLNSVKVLISIAATFSWELHQLGVTNAFLHSDLNEEVYMMQPPGFVAEGQSTKVCKLIKSIYGLKQSPCAWLEKFGTILATIGFSTTASDYSFFVQKTVTGFVVLILKSKLNIKDLGQLQYFLGIEVLRSDEGILLCQNKYAMDMLKEAGLLEAKHAKIPPETSVKLEPNEGEPLKDKSRYRRLVGKLIHLTVTRPDLSFAVSGSASSCKIQGYHIGMQL